jgi:DNA-3-methyladenine glycosylase
MKGRHRRQPGAPSQVPHTQESSLEPARLIRLSRAFFAADPLVVAPRLLGCLLAHDHPDRGLLLGRIVETEAYCGEEDLACHAAAGRTARTAIMYGAAGHAYVYLIYGIHHMVNVVTGAEGEPSAVLIRALEPVAGLARTSDGPGKLALAMDIDRRHNGCDFTASPLFIAAGPPVAAANVGESPRIGVGYAGAWADKPWRFFERGNPHVSRFPGRSSKRAANPSTAASPSPHD